jgi:hypothetical protein
MLPDLEELHTTAQAESNIWILQDRLLLYYRRLYITEDEMTPGLPLQTALIRKTHNKPLSGHPGYIKLRQLLKEQYYWLSIGKDINQYYSNCHTYRRSHRPRDKKPGLLHPLPVPDRPW